MSTVLNKIPTDTWIMTTWNEYLQETENPDRTKAKYLSLSAFICVHLRFKQQITNEQKTRIQLPQY